MSVRRRWLATRPSCSRSRVLRSILVTSVNGEAHVLEDRETAGSVLYVTMARIRAGVAV